MAAHQAPPIPGILQARALEWVAISFSNTEKWKMKVKSLSPVRLLATPWTAAFQAPLSKGFSRQEYWSGVPLPSPKKKKKDIQIYKADLCLPRGWGDAGRKHQEFGIRHYKRLRRWWMNEARNYKSKWNRRGSLGSCCTPHSVNVTDCFLSKLQENLSNIFLSRLPILKLFLI